jgi:hypothetical protein
MNCSSVPTFCHESCNQPNHAHAAPEHRCFKLSLECDGDLDGLLPCDAEELVVGQRCEGDGTLSDADNCPGGFDVYNFTHRPVVAAPAQTSIPTPGQASKPASATRPTPIPTSAPTPPDQQTQPTPCGGTIQGSTTNANAVPGKPYELWYEFSAPENGTYTIDACASSFDTELRILASPTREELATCDNCGGCADGTRSRLAVWFAAGRYTLVVGGHTAQDKGDFAFTLACPVPLVMK